MTTPLESLNFYTKVLTGMVLLLNIGLLVSIRMAWKFAQRTSAVDQSEQGIRMWAKAKRYLAVLILVVVSINTAAVFTNHHMIKASRELATQLPQDGDAELMLGMNK